MDRLTLIERTTRKRDVALLIMAGLEAKRIVIRLGVHDEPSQQEGGSSGKDLDLNSEILRDKRCQVSFFVAEHGPAIVLEASNGPLAQS